MGKTIIISNRLPVKINAEDGKFDLVASEGGLATGLGSIYKKNGNIWIGWPGMYLENEDQKTAIDSKLLELNLHPVYLTQEEINQYYEGFSNEILWPVFHYMTTYARYENSFWEFYELVNRKFCDQALSLIEPGDTIWIHDYQLLLLPGLIRKEKPGATIGFFQHIPFPSFEIFRLLPWRTELLEGLLGADLVGFHTYDDARHFLSASRRILSVKSNLNLIKFEDRKVMVETIPMGIDDTKYALLTEDIKVKEEVEALKQTFQNLTLILSIDRLDYSKGILQRLQAFDRLLKENHHYREYVSMYMIIVPSRDTVPLYKELRDEIDKLVGNINARFRTNTWTPINYFYRSVPIEMLSALYQVAKICLVTPMRDGMNLVCKEFVASRVNNDGVLILSEMAGAAKELIDAVIVNPNNIEEICGAMVLGLNMSKEEQAFRMTRMRDLVMKYNVHFWVELFMKRLKEIKQSQHEIQFSQYISIDIMEHIASKYAKVKKRLILLDYDGTLIDFSVDINAVSPDRKLLRIIKSLTDDNNNKVVLISGRNYTTLQDWFGNMKLDLVGEHGVWQRKHGTEWQEIIKLDSEWKSGILPILKIYCDRTPGSFIEEKSHSLVWHYRKADEELANYRANELISDLHYLISDLALQILSGNKVIEIKSRDINKGKAALSYIQSENYQFILAIGDDKTDEDMFKVINEVGNTIKVGDNKSAAKYYVNNTREVRNFLNNLIDTRKSDNLLSRALKLITGIKPGKQ
ncbi:MAG: bifunctional alpha,alpha-trehalose-phosphate synthase (UDP-forming)/trehalose-phosphatase [Bacteroidota bacterium]